LRRAVASANAKLSIACVGIGHMGSTAVQAASAEYVAALCDVDWRDDTALWGDRSPSRHAAEFSQAKKFNDYREMLDAMGDTIDAVFVSTPDHTHFTAAMAAMQRGKHVFVQKPLARNVWQVRTLQKAAHRYGVQTIMGNQGHCSEGIRLIKEWFDAGVLGEVREVHCWTDRPSAPWFIKPSSIPPTPVPIPEGLDFDLWQGPVPDRPYCEEYLPQRWRAWWDYGTGVLGDIGCHCLDAPFWALRLGAPVSVDVQLSEPANDQFTPFGAHVTYEFPARGALPPVTLHWYEGTPRPPKLQGMDKLPSNGMYMIGSEETVYHEDMRPNSPMLWPRERMQRYSDVLTRKPLPRVKGGPFEELIQAIKGEGPAPGSNFDYAAPLTELVLLGAIAIRTGQRIEWDSDRLRITNHPEFDKFLKGPVRDGWAFGEDLWDA
jgi:predicted dehydrogenase